MLNAIHSKEIPDNLSNYKINTQDIPNLYEMTYTDNVEDYLVVYNSLTKRGVQLLERAAAFYFSLIDGKRTLNDIFKMAQQEDKRIVINDVIQYFNQFLKSRIIYFDENKKLSILPRKLSSTLNVWFHITNQCNLRCKYCYIPKSSENMSMNIANEALDKIYISAGRHGIKKISFLMMGGEPVLELPKILTLMKKIKVLNKKYNITAAVNLISNGILITEEIARTLKKNKIGLQISIDGLEKYHDKLRVFPSGKGSFKYVLKGIDNLQKVGVSFNAIIVVTRKNVAGIPEFIKYLQSKNIRFSFNFFRDNPQAQQKLICDNDTLIKTLTKVYKYLFQNPSKFSLLSHLDKINFNPRLVSCVIGESLIAVRQDGKLTSCQMTMDTSFGSINDEDVIEQMRKKGNFVKPHGLTVNDKIPCKSCIWKYICAGGCPFFTNQYYGRYDTHSPYCRTYKSLIPLLLRAEAKRIIKFNETHTDVMKGYKPN